SRPQLHRNPGKNKKPKMRQIACESKWRQRCPLSPSARQMNLKSCKQQPIASSAPRATSLTHCGNWPNSDGPLKNLNDQIVPTTVGLTSPVFLETTNGFYSHRTNH